MTGRGTLARLRTLEERERARVAHVEAVTVDTLRRALHALTPEDQAAWWACGDCQDTDAQRWAHLDALTAHLADETLTLPHAEDARTWAAQVAETPEGHALPVPSHPSAFAAYFDAKARQGDALAYRVPLSPDVQTVGQWARALWRFEAALAGILGGGA